MAKQGKKVKKGEKGEKLYDVSIQSCFNHRKLYRLNMRLKSLDEWGDFNVNLRKLVARYDENFF